jgi:hypothetical protein
LERVKSDEFEFALEKLPGTRCGDSRACRDKNLARRCGGVFSERPRKKKKQGRVRERNTGRSNMTFTGTLIESLMATVERAEHRAYTDEPLFAEQMVAEPSFAAASLVQPWFLSVRENADYDSKFLGVT